MRHTDKHKNLAVFISRAIRDAVAMVLVFLQFLAISSET
jgi:hypothetical protein